MTWPVAFETLENRSQMQINIKKEINLLLEFCKYLLSDFPLSAEKKWDLSLSSFTCSKTWKTKVILFKNKLHNTQFIHINFWFSSSFLLHRSSWEED